MFSSSIFINALLAGLGVAIAAAPLGCFVIWRRMAYFGDAVSHAALMGVGLALALQVSVLSGVLVAALLTALFLQTLQKTGLSSDTSLGVIAHASLAFGLVGISLFGNQTVGLEAFLFGDILIVSKQDLVTVWIGAIIISAYLIWRWSALLTSILNPDLAHAAGINPNREYLGITLLLAILVAVAIKVVGALLITAMLIIPAAAARPLSRSPEQMAILAAFFGCLSAVLGIGMSVQLDTPTGPTIITAASLLFVVTIGISALRKS